MMNQTGPMVPPTEESPDTRREIVREPAGQELEEPVRSIVVSPGVADRIDDRMIAFQYYNCFNYALLSGEERSLNLTLGVISTNPGEGKTLVACNLAVSLAMGYEKETVLVDLNLRNPRLHQIFGTEPGPGLHEALESGPIHVSRTGIRHLSVLTAGSPNGRSRPAQASGKGRRRKSGLPPIGLGQLADFRAVMRSLEDRYDFVIVDMPAIESDGFPILYSNQLDGLLVVVDTRRTKRADVDRLFRRVHKRQVMGFVYNRFEEDE